MKRLRHYGVTKHAKTAAQVCSRWGIQQGVTTLPGVNHQERQQNTDISLILKLTDAEMTQLVPGKLRRSMHGAR